LHAADDAAIRRFAARRGLALALFEFGKRRHTVGATRAFEREVRVRQRELGIRDEAEFALHVRELQADGDESTRLAGQERHAQLPSRAQRRKRALRKPGADEGGGRAAIVQGRDFGLLQLARELGRAVLKPRCSQHQPGSHLVRLERLYFVAFRGEFLGYRNERLDLLLYGLCRFRWFGDHELPLSRERARQIRRVVML